MVLDMDTENYKTKSDYNFSEGRWMPTSEMRYIKKEVKLGDLFGMPLGLSTHTILQQRWVFVHNGMDIHKFHEAKEYEWRDIPFVQEQL